MFVTAFTAEGMRENRLLLIYKVASEDKPAIYGRSMT